MSVAKDPNDRSRLPPDVEPKHYNLTIKTDLQKRKFEGSVTIVIKVKKTTSTIVLHAVKLNFKGVSILYGSNSQTPKCQSLNDTLDNKTELATFKFPNAIPAGTEAELIINFDAELTESLAGYYLSTWKKNGAEQCYSLTHFQPTSARRAFPCWDEMELKATYSITMISRKDTVNLSNMDVLGEETYEGEWKTTKFNKTPRMSSYLVAFANGHFKHIESKCRLEGNEILLRFYGTQDHIEKARFALQVKERVLPRYEKMFKVPYPLPKLDTLIVHDFDIGAMENWGLITGRATSFCLDDPDGTDVLAKREVAVTMCHEVSHMWFGNYTTPVWWDNLYLNEGFATLVGEVIVIDLLYPEWKIRSTFINDHLEIALSTDAKLSSHAIESPCPDADTAMQLFDDLSYRKGAAVLRMLSAFVGEEVFLDGVSKYLKAYEYKNAVSENLWKAIGVASNKDISTMMGNWVSEMGFPFLTVSENRNSITVRQDRFLSKGRAVAEHNKTVWHVPLSIATVGSDGKLASINKLLTDKETEIHLDINKPYKLNHGTTGFYRVHYTPERLEKIKVEASKKHSVFNRDDCIGLINDVFALASAGIGDIRTALTLVRDLPKEMNYAIWQCIQSNLDCLKAIFWESETISKLLENFCRSLYVPLVKKLGYKYSKEDSANTNLLRTLAICGAAGNKEPGVVNELKAIFHDSITKGSKIPSDLETMTYITAVKYGGQEAYDTVMSIFDNSDIANSKASKFAIYGVCASENQRLFKKTLKIMLDRKKVKDQDVYFFIDGLASNAKVRRRVAHAFRENYNVIIKRFENTGTLSYLVSAAFRQLSSKKDVEYVDKLFEGKHDDVKKFGNSLGLTKDSIRLKSAQYTRLKDGVEEWLQKWDKEFTTKESATNTGIRRGEPQTGSNAGKSGAGEAPNTRAKAGPKGKEPEGKPKPKPKAKGVSGARRPAEKGSSSKRKRDNEQHDGGRGGATHSK